MKKRVALLAGLLLISGQVLGANIRLRHTNFEATYNLVDSIYGPGSVNNGRDWDAFLRFRAEVDIDLGNHGNIATLIDLSNVDSTEASWIDGREYKDGRDENKTVKMHYTNSFEDFTVGIGALVLDGTDGEKSVPLETLMDDSAFIRWNVMGSKDTSLTFYPYAVPLTWGDWRTEETFDFGNDEEDFYQSYRPGFVLDHKVSDTLNTTFKLAKLDARDYTDKDNNFAYQGIVNTHIAGFDLNAYYGSTTWDKDDNVTAYGLMASTNLIKNSTVRFHFNAQKEGNDDLQTWYYLGGDYYLPSINNYSVTAFGSILLEKNINWFDGDLRGNALGQGENPWDPKSPDTLTTIEAGVRFAQGNFAISPIFNLYISENQIFAEKGEEGDKGASSKRAYSLGVKFSHAVWS